MKALVLHSGGLDSSVLLAGAIKEHGVENVSTIGVSYGQKHQRELRAAQEVRKALGVTLNFSVSLPELIFKGSGSTIMDADKPNPELTYEELDAARGISPTYVPFRNGNMLSVATAIALKLWQAEENLRQKSAPATEVINLLFGAHAEDARHWAYPDCTPEFNGAMAAAIFVGSYQRVRLCTPFQWMTKAEIVRSGVNAQRNLGAQFLGLTYSCYNGGEKHCGKCPTCMARHAAFVSAGVFDPTDYEVMPGVAK